MTATDPSTIPLVSAPAADVDGPLADLGPRAGADSGDPRVAGRVIYRSEDPLVEVGVWSCTPGGWPIVDRPDTESIRLLEGRARLTDADGRAVELGPGDVLVLPRGWSGRWDVLEPVRKLYVITR
jgi:uncharacterized cupin superfamily protein